jgi:hypothetical protein
MCFLRQKLLCLNYMNVTEDVCGSVYVYIYKVIKYRVIKNAHTAIFIYCT